MDMLDTLVNNLDNINNNRKFLFTTDDLKVYLTDAFDCAYGAGMEAAFASIDADNGERVIYINEAMLYSDFVQGALWHEAGHHHYMHDEDVSEEMRNWNKLTHEAKKDILAKGLCTEINYINEMEADSYAADHGYATTLIEFLEKYLAIYESSSAVPERDLVGIRNRVAALRARLAA